MLRAARQLAPCLLRTAEQAVAVRGVKATTFLKGLEVDPDAEKNTPEALRNLITAVGEALPESVAYRRHVENYAQTFLKTIEESPSQGDAEQVLGRQFEEIQEDVKAELEVIKIMAEWKPWESPDGHVPKLFADVKDMPSNNRAFRDLQHELGS